MITYWILGHCFAENHDRAIRFIDVPNQGKRDAMNIPKDSKIKEEWCNKCSAWHLTRLSSVGV